MSEREKIRSMFGATDEEIDEATIGEIAALRREFSEAQAVLDAAQIPTQAGTPGETAIVGWSLRDRVAECVIRMVKAQARLTDGQCLLAGPGRGDCLHAIGLPGISIPGQHDGPDDTVDVYGKPNGWCWFCWRGHQLEEAQARITALERKLKYACAMMPVEPLLKFHELCAALDKPAPFAWCCQGNGQGEHAPDCKYADPKTFRLAAGEDPEEAKDAE